MATSWYLESAESGLLGRTGQFSVQDGKDLGHPKRETCLSPVALFAELEPV